MHLPEILVCINKATIVCINKAKFYCLHVFLFQKNNMSHPGLQIAMKRQTYVRLLQKFDIYDNGRKLYYTEVELYIQERLGGTMSSRPVLTRFTSSEQTEKKNQQGNWLISAMRLAGTKQRPVLVVDCENMKQ